MAVTCGWLIDKSTLAKMPIAAERVVWDARIARGLVRATTVTLLEPNVLGLCDDFRFRRGRSAQGATDCR